MSCTQTVSCFVDFSPFSCFFSSSGALLTTGFWAYRKVAPDTMNIATTVYMSIAMPNMIQHNTAVNMSSSALANVLRMELRDRRKSETTMPMAALLIMIQMTDTWHIEARLSGVKAVTSWPRKPRATALHTIESTYINTFCIIMWTSLPRPFNKCSL